MVLFEQHPYFVRRRSRASGYRHPCSNRIWSASRVGTLPSFFKAGRRLYRRWTVHQCWCSISPVDSFSFLILAFVCHAYPAFYSILVFAKTLKVCSLVLGSVFRFKILLFSVWTGPKIFLKRINRGLGRLLHGTFFVGCKQRFFAFKLILPR